MAGQLVVGIGTDDGADARAGIAAHRRLDGALGSHDARQHRVFVLGHRGGKAQLVFFLLHAEGVEDVVQHGLAVGIKHLALDGAETVKLQRHVHIALEGGQLVVDHPLHGHRLGGAEFPHVLQILRGDGIGLGKVRAGQHLGLALFRLARHIVGLGAARRIGDQDDAAAFVVEGHVGGGDARRLEQAAEAQGHEGQLVHRVGHLDHGKGIGPVKPHLPPPRWRGWRSPDRAGPERLHPSWPRWCPIAACCG